MSEETTTKEVLTDQQKVENAENALYNSDTKPESENVEETEKVADKSESVEEKSEAVVTEDGEKKEETTEEDQAKEVEYELKLNEESLLDNSHVEDVTAFAKENNLSNEKAQELLEKQEAVISKYVDGQMEAYKATQDEWRKQVINDPQLGGDNLKKTTELARSVVERFGTEEFISILRDTGYGDHPAVVSTLSKIGALMANDSLIMPGSSNAPTKTVEEVFYGNNTN